MDTFSQVFGYIFIFLSLYFEIFLVLSFFEKKEPTVIHTPDKNLPVTILIPVFNEEKTIAKTLDSIIALDYPSELIRVIIIDDGSTDGTTDAVAPYLEKYGFEYVSKPNGGKYTALNIGISLTTTPIVGCLDADSFVYPDALCHIIKHFDQPDVMAVSPSMIVWQPQKIIQKMQKAEYYYGNFLRQALAKLGALYITAGPFSFFRREVFDTIGLYKHAHNTEDMEIAMRMQKNHMKIVYAGDAVVYTSSPPSLRKLYKQRVRWVSGFFGNVLDYRSMFFDKKYGDLGMIILPYSLAGIVLIIPFVIISVFQMIDPLVRILDRISVAGWNSLIHFEKFDLFFINTSVMSLLSIILLALMIIFIAWGKKITHGNWKWNFDFIFLLLYSFIAPFWLIKALYNNIFQKKAAWR